MLEFLKRVNPPRHAKIIDLGGTSEIWGTIEHNFNVTLVNLPTARVSQDSTDRRYRYVEGDACDLSELFVDKSFDVVFSNSVIEHVGNEVRQEAFASEVDRLAIAHWVQTPDPTFPLEAHTRVLFFWQRREFVRERMIETWSKSLPALSNIIRETRAISMQRMRELFPESLIYTERLFGLPKSRTVYRPYHSS